MSLTYSSFVTDLANLLVIGSTDANYLTVLPNIIDDSELRIYRDADFLRTITRTSTMVLSTSARDVTLPTSVTFVVVESMNVYTPTGTSSTRNPLTQVSRDFIDAVYPQETSSSSTAVPAYFAMITDQTAIVGPPAGSPYTLEVVGTTRPIALSSGNSSTYLTQYFPDLFLAAACVYGNAYLKNFGASADDPKASMSWENHYGDLLRAVQAEENRKKSQGPAWQPKSQGPDTPQRV